MDTRKSRIRVKLAVLGITADDLAVSVGISSGHMSKVINGRFNPGPELAKNIAKALGSTVAHLKL